MIELVVVRHGETDWNRERRLQGHLDTALNEAGIAQASRLAAALANDRIAAIHASDLARALATAEPIATALGLPVHRDARLRERCYGLLEGNLYDDLANLYPEHAAMLESRHPTHAMPGGESQETFSRRVVDAVGAIAAREERRLGAGATILIVTHGGVLDMLYRAANDVPLDDERPCPIPNAVINRLACDAGRLAVTAWAVVPPHADPSSR